MDLLSALSQRINLPDVRRLVEYCVGRPERCDLLWSLICSADRTVSVNALWVLTHFDATERWWISARRDELADMLLAETDVSKKRMLLQLLRDMDYEPDDIRTDLLDFCLSKINAECEPYAVRAFSIYLAFKQCRHFPELVAELEEHMSMLALQPMSAGLVSARNTTVKRINRLK